MAIPVHRILVLGACFALSTTMLGATPVTADPIDPVVAHSIGPTATRLNTAISTSATGRYALGQVGRRYVVLDTHGNRVVRTLPSSSAYRYGGLSADGTLISYQRKSPFAGCATYVPKVRNRKTNKSRWLATDSHGRRLRASWRASSCGDQDDEFFYQRMPNFSAATLSGNSRYAAFCANLVTPNGLDLYVKNLRTGHLVRHPNVCTYRAGDLRAELQQPQVSQDANVILAPGDFTSDEQTWGESHLLVGGAERIMRDARDPRLTADGSAVYFQRMFDCSYPTDSTCRFETHRYDVAAGTDVTLPTGWPHSSQMSGDGQLALITAPQPAPLSGLSIRLFDRATGAWSDLTGAFAGAGVTVLDYNEAVFERSPALLSRDGRLILALASTGAVQTFIP